MCPFLYHWLDYYIRSSESFYNDENEEETIDQLQSSFKKEKVPVLYTTEGNKFNKCWTITVNLPYKVVRFHNANTLLFGYATIKIR